MIWSAPSLSCSLAARLTASAVAYHRAHPGRGAEDLGRLGLAPAPPVPVPTGLGERLVAHQEPRAFDHTSVHRSLEAPVRAARVPYGGEALHERVLKDPGHEQDRQVGWVLPVLVQDVHVDRAYVHVGVGKARHKRHARAVDLRVVAARAGRSSGSDLPNGAVLDQHRGTLPWVGPGTVDEERVGEKRGFGHRLGSPS